MTITPVGNVGVPPQPNTLARTRVSPSRGAQSDAFAAFQDQVTLSPAAREASQAMAAGAEAPVLHLSPAELRALVAPEGAESPVRNAAGSDLR